MPDFGKLEQEADSEAKDHSSDVDKGLQAADKEADTETPDQAHSMIDKGEQEAEKEVGGDRSSAPADANQ